MEPKFDSKIPEIPDEWIIKTLKNGAVHAALDALGSKLHRGERVDFGSDGMKEAFQIGLKRSWASGGMGRWVLEIERLAKENHIQLNYDDDQLQESFMRRFCLDLSRGEIENVKWMERYAKEKGIPIQYDADKMADSVAEAVVLFLMTKSEDEAKELIKFSQERGIPFGMDHAARFFMREAENAETADDVRRIVAIANTHSVPLDQPYLVRRLIELESA